jgi:hypothetical protein
MTFRNRCSASLPLYWSSSMLFHLKEDYPNESAIIGRILAGYGELEYRWSHCLSAVLGSRGAAFRAFFRMRGEQQRIEVVDAIIRDHFAKEGFSDEYAETLGALRWCRNIRNQYAHCHWQAKPELGMFFTNMEESAKKATGDIMLPLYYVDENILKLQEEYCDYTLDWLFFIEKELRKKRGETPIHDWTRPKIISQPPLYNPPVKRTDPSPA